ncbi:MAG: metallophosphoesterase family protein [Verrucomicrobia bacterium]|nr:metallophosphoesterase family protein [Verrucomicrobiota bacterium]
MMIKQTLLLLIAGLLLATSNLNAQIDRVGLYLTWQRDPTTTITVNWVNLYQEGTKTVWYRPLDSEQWKSKSGTHHQAVPSVLQVRLVELTGLKPDTMYEFSIGDEAIEDKKQIQRFRTMPAELTKPLTFVNGGDMMHSREYLDAMNARAAKLDPSFVFILGDIAYENGVYATRYLDWFQSWTKLMRGKDGRLIPIIVGIGNHEVKGHYNGRIPEDAPYFYGFFALPENRSYYALDFGRYLSLIALDSAHTQPISGKQTEWLTEALAKRTGQQFVFPGYHWPAYGTTKAAPGKLPSEHERSVEIRTNWISQFERFGVSAVFEHDHHTYKRTHPLRNHKRNDADGLLYLGDGAWGVTTRTPATPEEAWYLAKSEARRHLHCVTLHPEGRIEFKAYDADGTVFDQTTLNSARTRPDKK